MYEVNGTSHIEMSKERDEWMLFLAWYPRSDHSLMSQCMVASEGDASNLHVRVTPAGMQDRGGKAGHRPTFLPCVGERRQVCAETQEASCQAYRTCLILIQAPERWAAGRKT
jgi:hypothetical protein